jgi:hypothetical protein
MKKATELSRRDFVRTAYCAIIDAVVCRSIFYEVKWEIPAYYENIGAE